MTTLEIILIIYILLNWFLMIMFAILPTRVTDKVAFILVIICPPLIIGIIGEGIRKITTKEKEKEL